MNEQTGVLGRPVYEYTLPITEVVEFGTSVDALFSGQVPPPAEGARFDVYFEGPVTGPNLKGRSRELTISTSAPTAAVISTLTQN